MPKTTKVVAQRLEPDKLEQLLRGLADMAHKSKKSGLVVQSLQVSACRDVPMLEVSLCGRGVRVLCDLGLHDWGDPKYSHYDQGCYYFCKRTGCKAKIYD